jgi:hypothetical protein
MGNNSAGQSKPVALVARMSPLSTAEHPAVGEIRVADIPAAAWANVDSFRNGDNDPLEVVVETPVGKSKRGWNYRAQALQRVVDAVNNGGLPGFLGHQKPEDVSHQFPIPVTHWVGAKFDPDAPILDDKGQVVGKGKAYFRGVVDKAADNLKRWIRTKSITQTSIFGLPKLQRANDGTVDVVDYDPLSIDWTPLGRAGMQTRIVALGEMVDVTGPDVGEIVTITDGTVIEDSTEAGSNASGNTGGNNTNAGDTTGGTNAQAGDNQQSSSNSGNNQSSGSGDGSNGSGSSGSGSQTNSSGTSTTGSTSGSGSSVTHSGSGGDGSTSGSGGEGHSSSSNGSEQSNTQRGSQVTATTTTPDTATTTPTTTNTNTNTANTTTNTGAGSEGNSNGNQGGQGGHKVTVAEAVAALKEGRAKPDEVLGEMGWTPAEVLPVLKVDLPTAAVIIDKDEWNRLQARDKAFGEMAGVFGLEGPDGTPVTTPTETLVARTKEAHTAESNVTNAEFNGRVSTILGEMVVNEMARPLVGDLVTPHLTKDMSADQIKSVVGEMLARQSVKNAIGNLLEAGSQSPNGGQAHTTSSGQSVSSGGGSNGSNGSGGTTTNEFLRRKTVRVAG